MDLNLSKPVDLHGFSFSTHLSLSSPAQINEAIEAELSKSELAGLRQAELIIYARLEALCQFQDAQRRNSLDRLDIKEQIDRCDWLILVPWLSKSIDRRRQRLELDLLKLDANDFFLAPLVRDALIELRTAKDFRWKILDRSPELGSYSDNLKVAASNSPIASLPASVRQKQPVVFANNLFSPISRAVSDSPHKY